MRRWTKLGKLFGLIGVSIALILGFLNASSYAIRPTLNNCIEFEDRLVCPDNYCQPGSENFTCDSHSQQCYCKPNSLSNSPYNKHCEIATGSEMYFERDYNQASRPVSAIYLGRGAWQPLIERLLSLSNNDESALTNNGIVKITKDGTATYYIKFTPSNSGEQYNIHNYYSSSFLNLLSRSPELILNNPSIVHSQWSLGFIADIDPGSTTGQISVQTFETNTNGQTQICSVRPHHLPNSSTPFYQKLSPSGWRNNDDPNFKVACETGLAMLTSAILPHNQDNFFSFLGIGKSLAQPQITLSRNCTAHKVKPGILGNLLNDTPELSNLASSLIVSPDQKRLIHEAVPEDMFMGQMFKAESPAERDKKVQSIIDNYCQKTCQTAYDQHPSCANCDGQKIVLTNLQKNPHKTYSQIMYDILSDDKREANNLQNCAGINPSFGYLNTAYTTQYQTDLRTDYRNQTITEKTLNKRLPQSLTKVCEQGWQQSSQTAASRVLCKVKALTCYEDSLKPDLNTSDVCSILNNKNLATTKWAFCPVLATEAEAADQLHKGEWLDKILGVSSANLGDDAEQVWRTFRDIANLIIIIGFIVVIISQLTGVGLSNYQIKKMLPRLIIVVILINLSMFAMRLILDIMNITGYSIDALLGNIIRQTTPNLSFISVVSDIMMATVSVGMGVGLLALGGLAFMIPLLLSAIIGAAAALLLIALRQVMIIALAILAPIAIASLILPNNKWFNKWLQSFIGLAALYPLITLLTASAKLIKNVILANDAGSPILRLVAMVLPALSIFALPSIIKKILLSSSQLGERIDHFINGFQGRSQRHHTQSYFGSSIQQNHQHRVMTFFAGNRRRGFATGLSRFFGNLQSSNAFNILTSNAGRQYIRRANQIDYQVQSQLKELINGDAVLLMALLKDRGQQGVAYRALSKSQRDRYDLIAAGGQTAIRNLAIIAPEIMASSGVFNIETINQVFKQAQDNGANEAELSASMVAAFRTSQKKGDAETAGLMFAYLKNSNRDYLQTSDQVIDLMTALSKANPNFVQKLILQAAQGNNNLDKLLMSGDPDVRLLAAFSKQHLNFRDVLSAAMLLEVKRSNRNLYLIEQGFTALSRQLHLDPGFSGKIEQVSPVDMQHLGFMINLHQLVSEEAKAKIKLVVDRPDSGGSTKLENIQTTFDSKILEQAKKILPAGWQKDRGAMAAIEHTNMEDIRKEVRDILDKIAPEKLLNQMFNPTRVANDKLGIKTDQLALHEVQNKLQQSVIDAQSLKSRKPNLSDKDLGEALSTAFLMRLGRSWAKLPSNIQASLEKDVRRAVKNITNRQASTMDQTFALIGVDVREVKR